MKVLGITASLSLPFENNLALGDIYGLGHDAAAVLVSDGQVISAIEEERLNRIKHTNKSPTEAIRFCLYSNNLTLKDIDAIAVNFLESTLNFNLRNGFLEDSRKKELFDARYYIHRMIKEALSEDIEDSKIHFVPHHLAHAESAYRMSGYEDSLVLVTDGLGDDCAGIIESRKGGSIKLLDKIPTPLSLGMLYLECIKYLGYYVNDEYKVMGLAPYGDPKKYRRYFNKLYKLLPEGKFIIDNSAYPILFEIGLPRRRGEAFTQVHKDIAASIQKMLEDILLHFVKYNQNSTGHDKLCIAGGVAHNCSANGKILYAGLFNDIFIQPAADDSGAALGAALYVHDNIAKVSTKNNKLKNVYWGTKIHDSESIRFELEKWQRLIRFEKHDCIAKKAGTLLAEGYILGWVQGKSEFGPRALGNRSIVADPRPSENKHIINQMVKKREGYRPFAPSVLEEYANDYFVIPLGKTEFPFMNFVLEVRQERRELLGAITHVDGTARVQTVSRKENDIYWSMINEFRKITGVPIVLNTSFNNNEEPIVDSVEDAIICYLTTKLHYLVIGDYLIWKKEATNEQYWDFIPTVPPQIVANVENKYISLNERHISYYLKTNYHVGSQFAISEVIYLMLNNMCGKKSLRNLMNNLGLSDSEREHLTSEIINLWENRLIRLRPMEEEKFLSEYK